MPATQLPIVLRRDIRTALSVQLSSQIRDLVASGVAAAGSRLPSSRALAAELGVARAVVEQGYDQLLAEGWTEGRRGAGTFVAAVAAAQSTPSTLTARVTPAHLGAVPELVSLDTGTPWQDSRLDAGWRRAWRHVALARIPMGYPSAFGLEDLREELAAYVGRRRGIACTPQQVMVTTGTTHGWSLVLDVARPGAVALEDPGYRAAAEVAAAMGRDVLDIGVNVEGIDVVELARRRRDVCAVYVTPAHQHPLGVTMSAARRVDLLTEARRRGAWVVEDDYDSEFRYDVAPLPALAALDQETVVYLGTSSKILQPGMRIGWLVASESTVSEIAARRARRHDHPSWPVQHALLTMLREGHLDRAARAARRVYAERSRLVAERLGTADCEVADAAGMYVTVQLTKVRTRAAISAAREAGFQLPSLQEYCRSAHRHGVVLGFGGIDNDALRRVLDVVVDALKRPHPSPAELCGGEDVSQWGAAT
ncbi:MAG: PLP-dependent aminotransferase family protein [Propionibacteriales bacterium]|nr:PLP-dependent aminotransferase family protein [Propionibacteriales bacterium]